jgi:hypothetical protein
MTADLIYLSTRRPAPRETGHQQPSPYETAEQRVKRVLTNDVMAKIAARVLGKGAGKTRAQRLPPLKPETAYEHIGVLAIGAADQAVARHYLRAAAMLQTAADIAFAEAGVKPRKKGRRQPTTTKR